MKTRIVILILSVFIIGCGGENNNGHPTDNEPINQIVSEVNEDLNNKFEQYYGDIKAAETKIIKNTGSLEDAHNAIVNNADKQQTKIQVVKVKDTTLFNNLMKSITVYEGITESIHEIRQKSKEARDFFEKIENIDTIDNITKDSLLCAKESAQKTFQKMDSIESVATSFLKLALNYLETSDKVYSEEEYIKLKTELDSAYVRLTKSITQSDPTTMFASNGKPKVDYEKKYKELKKEWENLQLIIKERDSLDSLNKILQQQILDAQKNMVFDVKMKINDKLRKTETITLSFNINWALYSRNSITLYFQIYPTILTNNKDEKPIINADPNNIVELNNGKELFYSYKIKVNKKDNPIRETVSIARKELKAGDYTIEVFCGKPVGSGSAKIEKRPDGSFHSY